jgi:hypothetical protein
MLIAPSAGIAALEDWHMKHEVPNARASKWDTAAAAAVAA